MSEEYRELERLREEGLRSLIERRNALRREAVFERELREVMRRNANRRYREDTDEGRR